MQPKTPFALLSFLFAMTVIMTPAARCEDGEFYVNTYRSIGSISPLGVREMAMGRSGVGLADGVASLGQNPAALGAFKGTGFDAALGFDWLSDDADNTTQFSFKLGGAMNIDRWSRCTSNNQAIGALLYTEGYSGAQLADMKRSQTGVLGGYGIHLLDNLLVGVSVALFDGKWRGNAFTYPNGTAVPAMDRKFLGGDFKVGGLYRIQDETTLGATLGFATGSYKDKNIYTTANGNINGSGSMQRFSISAGIAHQLADETLLLGDLWFKRMQSDLPGVVKEHDNSWGISAGVEQQIICDMLALRGGIYYDHTAYGSTATAGLTPNPVFVPGGNLSKGRAGFTAGVGVKLYGWDMGYGLDVNTAGDVKNMLDVKKEW